ncbi:MAG: hypothetical protein ACLUVY_15020 [Bacteroides uniformis]
MRPGLEQALGVELCELNQGFSLWRIPSLERIVHIDEELLPVLVQRVRYQRRNRGSAR